MAKDRFYASKQKWKKENMRAFTTRMSKVSESEMIEWMEEHKPTNAYIKGLIRKDMESKQ